MEDDRIKLVDFVKDNKITADVIYTGLVSEPYKDSHNVKKSMQMDSWTVTLHRDHKDISTTFKTGLGLRARNRQKIRNRYGYINSDQIDLLFWKNMGKESWLLEYCVIKNPEVEDVLNSLALDAGSYDNSRNFEDFCSDFGYDEDSRTAEKIYNACAEMSKSLKYFLGSELYDTLLYKVESL